MNVTNVGALWNTSGINRTGAYIFNGVTNYIQVNDTDELDFTGNLSLFFYVTPAQSTSQISSNQGLLSKLSSYQVFLSSVTDELIFRIENTGTNCGSGFELTAGNTYAIAATYNSTHMHLYVNGSLVNTC